MFETKNELLKMFLVKYSFIYIKVNFRLQRLKLLEEGRYKDLLRPDFIDPNKPETHTQTVNSFIGQS